MQKSTDLKDRNDDFIKRNRPSATAEVMALNRAVESLKTEDMRICYDPYAIRFIERPDYLKLLELMSCNPQKAMAIIEEEERLFPGVYNTTLARVRYFDDFVRASASEGIEQIVLLGAGYDSRAYRIEELNGNVKVFEVDNPATQMVKMEKIREIFGGLPDHVVYVPVDLVVDDFGQRLIDCGYKRSQTALFVMEGLVYYIPPRIVDEILYFIARNSGKGSKVIFDYLPESVVDGTCTQEAGKNLRHKVQQQGEPFQFGINKEMIEMFLAKRGFSQIRNVSSEDYKKAYFHGKNKSRAAGSLLSFVHAAVM
jgi:methyltransferase (TIGR00027 family)